MISAETSFPLHDARSLKTPALNCARYQLGSYAPAPSKCALAEIILQQNIQLFTVHRGERVSSHALAQKNAIIVRGDGDRLPSRSSVKKATVGVQQAIEGAE